MSSPPRPPGKLHSPFERNRRFLAPSRTKKRFDEVKALLCQQTVWGRPVVREWQKGSLMRLYWPDRSYIYIDGTGAVRSSGGAAAKAKIRHGLH
jgi:hypothetical protein